MQMHLASRGKFATTVCGGPAPLALGTRWSRRWSSAGRRAMRMSRWCARRWRAASSEIVEACAGLVASSRLKSHLLAEPPPGALWPPPHSKLFDFEATARGAEWIDDVARAARARMQPSGALVIGHGDWRAEHVHFVRDCIVGAFDWDSLCKEREPALVGFTTHAYCADWSRRPPPAAPTIEEARAFVAEYEAARGRAFAADERRLCGAAFAYSCAYTARCVWGLARDERGKPGTFQQLVASHGPTLLEL